MAYNSNITIKIDGDTSALEARLSESQKKIKALRETGPSGTFSQLAQQYRAAGEEEKAKKIEEFRSKQQSILSKQINSDLKEQERNLLSLMRHYDNIQRGLSALTKETDAWNNKNKEAKNIFDQINKTTDSIKNIYQTMQPRGPGGPQGPQGPGAPGGPGGLGGIFGQYLRNLDPTKMLLGTAGIATLGKELYTKTQTYPERVAQREADIARMQSETERLQAQGKGYEMALFAPERARALERAKTRVGAERFSDKAELGIGTLAGAGLGAWGGMKLGAGIGAMFGGGFGAIPGGIIGAGIGLAGGGLTAFGTSMLSDRKRSMLFDQEAYDKEMGSIFAGTYKQQLAAERAKSYKKDLAAEFLEQKGQTYLSTQRQFGLSDRDLFSGEQSILRRAARAGYGDEDVIRSMRDIASAGGSARVAREGGQLSAELQRNLDITNASKLMGKISGVTGMSAIQSKDEIIRMQAEGVKLGLDNSEIRQYMEAAADIAYRTGGQQEVISGMLGAGVEGTGLATPRGIEAAQTALEMIKNRTSEMSGIGAQYEMAQLMGEDFTKLLGRGIKQEEMAFITGSSPEQIKDEDIKAMLESEGGEATPEAVKAMREKIYKIKGRRVAGPGEKRLKAVEEYQEMMESPDQFDEKEKRRRTFAYKATGALVEGEQFTRMGEPEQKGVGGIIGNLLKGVMPTTLSPEEIKKAQEDAAAKKSPRLLDEKLASQATDLAGRFGNLTEQTDALSGAFKKTIDMGEKAAQLYQEMNKLAGLVDEAKKQGTILNEKDIAPPASSSVSTTPTGKPK